MSTSTRGRTSNKICGDELSTIDLYSWNYNKILNNAPTLALLKESCCIFWVKNVDLYLYTNKETKIVIEINL